MSFDLVQSPANSNAKNADANNANANANNAPSWFVGGARARSMLLAALIVIIIMLFIIIVCNSTFIVIVFSDYIDLPFYILGQIRIIQTSQ